MVTIAQIGSLRKDDGDGDGNEDVTPNDPVFIGDVEQLFRFVQSIKLRTISFSI